MITSHFLEIRQLLWLIDLLVYLIFPFQIFQYPKVLQILFSRFLTKSKKVLDSIN